MFSVQCSVFKCSTLKIKDQKCLIERLGGNVFAAPQILFLSVISDINETTKNQIKTESISATLDRFRDKPSSVKFYGEFILQIILDH